jgi:Anticodon binding domain
LLLSPPELDLFALESLSMHSESPAQTPAEQSAWRSTDVEEILVDRGWLQPRDVRKPDMRLEEWLERAAQLFGPHAGGRSQLAALLERVFVYDAAALLRQPENQAVLARAGAREIIRELANQLLPGSAIDSDRFKEIIEALKSALPYRSRALFQPIRLALAGQAGEGELDRVILLLDSASKLDFLTPVKNARQRMLEFCSALD